MKRFYMIFEGRVQGVGFRSFVQMQAMRYHCTGWVRNMDNGSVELELQGKNEDLDQVIRILRQGNMFIRIDEYFIKEIPIITETKFKIKG